MTSIVLEINRNQRIVNTLPGFYEFACLFFDDNLVKQMKVWQTIKYSLNTMLKEFSVDYRYCSIAINITEIRKSFFFLFFFFGGGESHGFQKEQRGYQSSPTEHKGELYDGC